MFCWAPCPTGFRALCTHFCEVDLLWSHLQTHCRSWGFVILIFCLIFDFNTLFSQKKITTGYCCNPYIIFTSIILIYINIYPGIFPYINISYFLLPVCNFTMTLESPCYTPCRFRFLGTSWVRSRIKGSIPCTLTEDSSCWTDTLGPWGNTKETSGAHYTHIFTTYIYIYDIICIIILHYIT